MTETTQTESVKETVVRPDDVVVQQLSETVVDAGPAEAAAESVSTETSTVEVVDGDASVKVSGDTPVSLAVAAVLALVVVLGLSAKKFLEKR